MTRTDSRRQPARRFVLSGALAVVLSIFAANSAAEGLAESLRANLMVTDIFQPDFSSVAI
jgi:hypothetical protein